MTLDVDFQQNPNEAFNLAGKLHHAITQGVDGVNGGQAIAGLAGSGFQVTNAQGKALFELKVNEKSLLMTEWDHANAALHALHDGRVIGRAVLEPQRR